MEHQVTVLDVALEVGRIFLFFQLGVKVVFERQLVEVVYRRMSAILS